VENRITRFGTRIGSDITVVGREAFDRDVGSQALLLIAN
jgi:hypothetical protein